MIDREEMEGGDAAGGPQSRKDFYTSKYPGFKASENGLNLETGINVNRGCTDFLCVVVFLGFIAGMASVSMFGLTHGEPRAMVKPYDFKE